MEVDAGLTRQILEEVGESMMRSFPDIEHFDVEEFTEDKELMAFVGYIVASAYKAGFDAGLGQAIESYLLEAD